MNSPENNASPTQVVQKMRFVRPPEEMFQGTALEDPNVQRTLLAAIAENPTHGEVLDSYYPIRVWRWDGGRILYTLTDAGPLILSIKNGGPELAESDRSRIAIARGVAALAEWLVSKLVGALR